VGLLAGLLGSKRAKITCLNCGYSWDPAVNFSASKSDEMPTGCSVVILLLSFESIIAAIIASFTEYEFLPIFILLISVSIILAIMFKVNSNNNSLKLMEDNERIIKDREEKLLKRPKGFNNLKWGTNDGVDYSKLYDNIRSSTIGNIITYYLNGNNLFIYGFKLDFIIYKVKNSLFIESIIKFSDIDKDNLKDQVKNILIEQYGKPDSENDKGCMSWEWEKEKAFYNPEESLFSISTSLFGN
jgi:hypothetical protein